MHAPGMPGTFSPPPTSKETASQRSRHASRHVRHARVVMHVGIAHSRWRGKRSRHSRRMRNPQFYVSGKRPMAESSRIGFCPECMLCPHLSISVTPLPLHHLLYILNTEYRIFIVNRNPDIDHWYSRTTKLLHYMTRLSILWQCISYTITSTYGT